jgi:pimeloyl-ACP methyl ester carboxylesterase
MANDPSDDATSREEREHYTGDRFADLRRISQPTLAVNGVHDDMTPVRNSYWLSENLPNAPIQMPVTARCLSGTSPFSTTPRHSWHQTRRSHRTESPRRVRTSAFPFARGSAVSTRRRTT